MKVSELKPKDQAILQLMKSISMVMFDCSAPNTYEKNLDYISDLIHINYLLVDALADGQLPDIEHIEKLLTHIDEKWDKSWVKSLREVIKRKEENYRTSGSTE